MSESVEIAFDCLPLRTLPRFDTPVDADAADHALTERLREAVARHGAFNAYYLTNARCVFHLTNHPPTGTVAFRFEGVALTDSDDRRTRRVDLRVELESAVCDWLTESAVTWLADTVREAVRVEFDRYIDAGDLQKTIERIERFRAESDAAGGFFGMGL